MAIRKGLSANFFTQIVAHLRMGKLTKLNSWGGGGGGGVPPQVEIELNKTLGADVSRFEISNYYNML